jgi:hypothetical protein
MRPHLHLLPCIFTIGALAQNNGATLAVQNPAPVPTVAIVDVTVTHTIEIADYPTSATGLIYDTSPVKSNTGTPLAMPTSVFITAPSSNSTKTTVATALAGNAAANKTGTALPVATTKSLGSTLDVRITRVWESLLGIAVAVVVFC